MAIVEVGVMHCSGSVYLNELDEFFYGWRLLIM